MRYDRDGFPIPPDFEPLRAAGDARETDGHAVPRTGAGWKRLAVMGLVAGVLLPAIVLPEAVPFVRPLVVGWALERAAACEARSDIGGAVAAVGRALRWQGADAELLCLRAMLRLEDRDAAGALEDATSAAVEAPLSPQPLRVRALVHVVLGNADAALADAARVVSLATPGDAEALNFRAYVRALVGREVPEALADIDAAIAALGEASPELLDTRGYILYIAGRTQDAIDQLNLAIDGMQQNRRQLALLADRIDRDEFARRLRTLDHGLAVMLHHRALACEKAGLAEQAKQDFELARKKGFDPSRGIM
jgi:tetratricopeptide (TPR) repeat protein